MYVGSRKKEAIGEMEGLRGPISNTRRLKSRCWPLRGEKRGHSLSPVASGEH